jgi:hypothetical protein
MVVAIPPKIAVAKFIGQIKAVASTKFNKSGISEVSFFWQEEYGVFSFDGKRLPNYSAYVGRQKEHHAQGTIIPVLEPIGVDIAVRLQISSSAFVVEAEENPGAELEALVSPGDLRGSGRCWQPDIDIRASGFY